MTKWRTRRFGQIQPVASLIALVAPIERAQNQQLSISALTTSRAKS